VNSFSTAAYRVFQQLVVFRVVRDEVCGDGFGTIEDFTSAVFAPRFAENWRTWSRDGLNMGFLAGELSERDDDAFL
jgi:hypothetical protein